MRTTSAAYLKWLACCVALLMSLIAGFNWLVNPFSIFDAPSITGFNANKPGYVEHLRLTHSYRVSRMEPECVILGTSRAGRGLRTDHPLLYDRGCYNMALPAASLYEIRRYLQHAQSVRHQKLVIVSLDFRLFSGLRGVSGAFSETRLGVDAQGNRQLNLFNAWLPDMAASLTSTSALLASATTIRKQSWIKDTLSANGYWQPLTEEYDHSAGFSLQTSSSARRFRAATSEAATFPRNLEEFRRLLRDAHVQQTDVRLLIPPSHAWHWQTLWLSGLWPRFEEMKRQLVAINETEARLAGQEAYPLWDFSGAYGPALEKVPSNRTERMRWFWEPVHYKSALGDLILNRMLGTTDPSRGESSGFGVLLNATSVDAHLLRMRRQQEQYQENHAIDVHRIRQLMREAAPTE